MTEPPASRAAGAYPDRAAGVFETFLVVDGRPLELEAHLARLHASLRALFDAEAPPSSTRRLVLEQAQEADLARLRLDVAPDERGVLVADVRVAPVDASLIQSSSDRGVHLAPLVVAGGLGPHKWADRCLLAQAEADAAPHVPLLLDDDCAVLEASRANVFVVRDGVLLTPPADGRILPGVTRRRVVRLAEALGIPVREELFRLDWLWDASEVFLTGSVRGIEPVCGSGGHLVGGERRMTEILVRELRRCWAAEAAVTESSASESTDASNARIPHERSGVHAPVD